MEGMEARRWRRKMRWRWYWRGREAWAVVEHARCHRRWSSRSDLDPARTRYFAILVDAKTWPSPFLCLYLHLPPQSLSSLLFSKANKRKLHRCVCRRTQLPSTYQPSCGTIIRSLPNGRQPEGGSKYPHALAEQNKKCMEVSQFEAVSCGFWSPFAWQPFLTIGRLGDTARGTLQRPSSLLTDDSHSFFLSWAGSVTFNLSLPGAVSLVLLPRPGPPLTISWYPTLLARCPARPLFNNH